MDWNNAQAGYVIAAYLISAVCLIVLVAWCLLKDRAASSALSKLKD